MASISSSIISNSLEIENGELAYRNTIVSGGRIYVSSGGTANNTMINVDGRMEVYDGGIANNTTVCTDDTWASTGF